MVVVADPTDQLDRVLKRLIPSTKSTFKAVTFNGDGKVELFLEQFGDVGKANNWTDRETFTFM